MNQHHRDLAEPSEQEQAAISERLAEVRAAKVGADHGLSIHQLKERPMPSRPARRVFLPRRELPP
jgi:hypothetical protein